MQIVKATITVETSRIPRDQAIQQAAAYLENSGGIEAYQLLSQLSPFPQVRDLGDRCEVTFVAGEV